MSLQNRAYPDEHYKAVSLLHVKNFDPSGRKFSGVATTPTPDRVDDVVEPMGVEFANPLPLHLFHHGDEPVGHVTFGRPNRDGIPFEASIPTVSEDGDVKRLTDKAAHLVKYGLIRAVSIGFKGFADAMEHLKSGGTRFLRTEVLELSLVSIPANREATISVVKSLCGTPAAIGHDRELAQNTPGASGSPVVKVLPSRPERQMSKSISERIASFEATRAAKSAQLSDIQNKASDEGRTKDASEKETFATLRDEIKSIDEELSDLRDMETMQKAAAVPVSGANPMEAHASRGGQPAAAPSYIRVQQNDEPGIGFAKAVLCKAASFLSQGSATPLDIAKARYPDNDRVQMYLKATIPAGNTTNVTWAAPFVDPTNLASEFVEFQRPGSILSKLNLRMVPFNVRILGQTSGGDAYWVAEGAPKPVTKFDFNAITMAYHKVATIAVITKELARFSSPSAERIVRDSLAKAVNARIDVDLIDPTQAAVSGVNPASLTYGVTPMSPSGTTADAARSDLTRIVKQYLDNNNNVANLVLIMPASLALGLSAMRNSLGGREFDGLTMNGGMLEGIPVVTSQYAANQSGAGNLVIAVNGEDVMLADDGNVTVDVSTQASLQMLDNPTNNSVVGTATSMVSLWQTNSIGLLAEREITWAKARSTSVVYMDDVNWGSIGSPA